ncbi:sigma-70 family RNA polymerase sigma factor [Alicyclobacillus dauci]|uniref:Sigma-70 family RNA polymerase sigma factor n=1 Tax=Alicyclobacillus dauci TaxID=1475485 RepID=A0ABY6Z1R0_9BACL|nr:sigma-70 family RNA polymerase sigma factor [Alicyclobacillus dauci]WAH36622.1 sigma-70 family RNA polymerase sigma factor [Alicyclobacillus dauci]
MTEQELSMVSAEQLRPELTAYCYRMLGSIFDADDAVQDTMVRVFQGWGQFRQESSLRTWVYRIATNVCLDKLRGAKRRALPMDLSDPAVPTGVPQDILPHAEWVWPTPDITEDPADVVIRKHTVRLAFIAALQKLPPRQRAVLILNDVFQWKANETANAMGMTVAAVNSALQRARSTLSGANLTSGVLQDQDAAADRHLLDRYVDAFERYDVHALIELFQEEGSLSMPPFVMWVRGRVNLASFYETTRHHCFGSRLLPVRVNGTPAFAQYAPTASANILEPWGIHVPEINHGQIAHIHTFIDSALYPRLGLPLRIEA